MKKLLPLLLLLATTAFAQSPQSFKYQSVVRDAAGEIVATQNVSFQITLLQGSPGGTMVYQETFASNTNMHGLSMMDIGTGAVVFGIFSSIDWSNGPYFMQTELDVTGGSSYTDMGTAQLLSVPYALYAESAGSGGGANSLDMAYDQGGAGAGRNILADAGEVDITTNSLDGIALRTTNTNTGVALIAANNNAANTFSTIQAQTNSTSTLASAIVGSSTGAAWPVSGQVENTATAEAGMYGSNLRTSGGHGVLGIGFNGVVGRTNYSAGNAMFAENMDAIAPSGNGIGLAGRGYWGVVGEDRYLGGSPGAFGVLANGELGATGTKSFIIDHPSDPTNKFLKHFSTESNEVLNIYRGNVEFDLNGEAVVVMPDYYDLINKNPSYQLTPIGAFAQLYIKEEMQNGRFVIAGGAPGKHASWTVYAERNDPYLQQHPDKRDVVIEKREGQKGKYMMPGLYGESAEKKMIPDSGEVPIPTINLR